MDINYFMIYPAVLFAVGALMVWASFKITRVKEALLWLGLLFCFLSLVELAIINPGDIKEICNETSYVAPCGTNDSFSCAGMPEQLACAEYNQTQCRDISGCNWTVPDVCGGVSWWLKLEEADGGYGTPIYDQCAGNDFMRVGNTEQMPAVWTNGQFLGAYDDDWLIMDNASALTTGSRSWRTILNFSWKYGTGFYSDNESAFGQDWANFMSFESDDGFYCYCRQADTGLRSVYAPVSIDTWIDVLCSYDTADSNRLTIYINGTAISSNTGAACDYEAQQGQAVLDSYPVVGMLPRLTGVFDETLYRRQATSAFEAYCLWATNTWDCNTETYCYGTPNATCEELGEYGGQEKCFETDGCYWQQMASSNATCDSFNKTCYLSTPDWGGQIAAINMLLFAVVFWGVLFMLLIIMVFDLLGLAFDWDNGKPRLKKKVD